VTIKLENKLEMNDISNKFSHRLKFDAILMHVGIYLFLYQTLS